MTETRQLAAAIIEGLQERKLKNIVVVDMTELEAPCGCFVIAEGDSSVQIMSATEACKAYVREHAGARPYAVDGTAGCLWVAMDYGEVIVHIFQPETRAFYDIEHLWADAKITRIPDID